MLAEKLLRFCGERGGIYWYIRSISYFGEIINLIKGILKLLLHKKQSACRESNERSKRFIKYVESFSLLDYITYRISKRYKDRIRKSLARKYIKGNGIEIGAQANPLPIDQCKAHVTYVDRLSADKNRDQHQLTSQKIIRVDVFAEADDLSMFNNNSLDFVISNHLLEHMPNPLAAIIEWMRVLKDGGVLFLSIPNRHCNEYDFERSPCSMDHIINDFKSSEHDDIKEQHWREFVEIVDGINPLDPEFNNFLEINYRSIDNRIHMHVYDRNLMDEILEYLHRTQVQTFTEIDYFSLSRSFEIIYILKKHHHPGNRRKDPLSAIS